MPNSALPSNCGLGAHRVVWNGIDNCGNKLDDGDELFLSGAITASVHDINSSHQCVQRIKKRRQELFV